jgi:Domain of unknown function (DUF4157)
MRTTTMAARSESASSGALPQAQRGVLQRKCACGGTPGPTGQCVECRRKDQRGGTQTKLHVSQPGDHYEREAERVASQVVSASADHASAGTSHTVPSVHSANGVTLRLQRQLRGAQDDRADEPVGLVPDARDIFSTAELDHAQLSKQQKQTPAEIFLKADSSTPASVVPDGVAERISQTQGGGHALEPRGCEFMEGCFGADFSQVRVHANGESDQQCRNLGARAFTFGRDIYFARNEYRPETTAGRALLAHELTHVLQQEGGRLEASVQRACEEFTHGANAVTDTWCQTQQEAAALVTTACNDRDDFVYRDGPASHPWRRIPGFGCAHYVSHDRGISTGPAWANCRSDRSVTVGQVVQGRTQRPLAEAQVGDVWATNSLGHSGVVREVDAEQGRVRTEECWVSGNTGLQWHTDGSVYR